MDNKSNKILDTFSMINEINKKSADTTEILTLNYVLNDLRALDKQNYVSCLDSLILMIKSYQKRIKDLGGLY
jgi:hypothetical protein|tara:strand:+ start:264 stop:479 length:216 start_codon:yes stop_codon:yes gene_type:complete